MKTKRQIISIGLLFLIFFMLILDTKTALLGAKDGITICLNTIIPSLFPFIVITTLLVNRLNGISNPVLHRLGRMCGIPKGTESILLIGLVGGYPIGAQCLRAAYDNSQLTRKDADRMMGFCNNAGPSFIFGIGSCLFQSKAIPWIIWIIQILTALLVSFIVPGRNNHTCRAEGPITLSVSQAMNRSMKAMAGICSWVISFRIIIKILQHWILWLFPKTAQISIVGMIELANGCCELTEIAKESVRFVLCCVFMTFGGLCVTMQTVTVSGEIGIGGYMLGKLLQTVCSLIIAISITPLVFNENLNYTAFAFVLPSLIIMLKILYKKSHSRKKVVEIRA